MTDDLYGFVGQDESSESAEQEESLETLEEAEELVETKTYKGIDHYQDYVKAFNEVCYNSPVTAQITYHILLGQVLNKIFIPRGDDVIDMRIHGTVIGPSGSGKSKGGYFLESVATEAMLRPMRLTDFTDSGLIGSYEPPRGRQREPQKK